MPGFIKDKVLFDSVREAAPQGGDSGASSRSIDRGFPDRRGAERGPGERSSRAASGRTTCGPARSRLVHTCPPWLTIHGETRMAAVCQGPDGSLRKSLLTYSSHKRNGRGSECPLCTRKTRCGRAKGTQGHGTSTGPPPGWLLLASRSFPDSGSFGHCPYPGGGPL